MDSTTRLKVTEYEAFPVHGLEEVPIDLMPLCCIFLSEHEYLKAIKIIEDYNNLQVTLSVIYEHSEEEYYRSKHT